MDASEQVAYKHLLHRGFTVVYEPNGRCTTPDFLADGRVAIEVRRLNQNERTGGIDRGLEETAVPLAESLSKLLESLGPSTSGESWFVSFRFKRPIGSRKAVLRRLIKENLIAFRDGPTHEPISIPIAANFDLQVFRASKAHSTFFLLAGYSDIDSGGWILAEINKNLKLCINEKTRKVASVRHKYPEWWLVLIDCIGYGLRDLDREMFHDQFRVEHEWNKIILLDPRNHHRAFEI